ncbi:helix-turn-helix domain-containing protein [Sulfolobus sp. S-194]|uniref:helix-turn-helix domain-containing protein n=1 Tax=Sulfolobus sp. S-194 TaxID=2512240 RepID=UPI0014373557|nr:helix-turn-helix domain-containing protein [Sulfolobus sp. S-194]QIW24626.1 helix-turn-helix domain-containing protein [Sulfolobus sp. S-194]
MKDKLQEILLGIEHENCWTSLVGDYVVKTLNFSVDTEKNYIRSIIILDKAHKDLISKIRKTSTFIDYVSFSLSENGKILFDFRKRYKGSVMDTISKHNGIIIDGFKYYGKEFWRILIYESYLNELLEDLRSKGKLYVAKRNEFEIEPEDLSQQELKVLVTAYKSGYFDFPRRIKSDKVSKLVNISKSTFTYHLRSAEYKMIKKYIKELEFLNIINKIKEEKD